MRTHVADALSWLVPVLCIRPASAVRLCKEDVPLHHVSTPLSTVGPAHAHTRATIDSDSYTETVVRALVTKLVSPVRRVPDVAWAVGCVGRCGAVDGRPGRERETVPDRLCEHVRVDGVVHP